MVLAGFASHQGIQPGPLRDKCVIKAVFNILIDLIFDCTPLLYLMAMYMIAPFRLSLWMVNNVHEEGRYHDGEF